MHPVPVPAEPLSWTHCGNLYLRGTRFPCSMIEQDRQHESQIRSRKLEKASAENTERHPPRPAEGRRQVSRMTSIAGTGPH